MKFKTALVDPKRAARYGLRTQLAAWDSLPLHLKPHFDHLAPVFKLTKKVTVQWGGYEWTIERGFFWDGASIPLSLRLFGVSRFTNGLELYPCSIFHDAGCRGELPRLVKPGEEFSERKSRWRYDRMYYDLGVAAGFPRWKMRWQRHVLNVSTWFNHDPPLKPLPALVKVVRLGPEVKYSLDWQIEIEDV